MLKKPSITFPVGFELLIWLFYVCMYKYSYYLDNAGLPVIREANFPYLQICLYSICSTLYLIPYYRWAVPKLLYRKKYLWLFGLTLVVFLVLTKYNNIAFAWLFAKCTAGLTANSFFVNTYRYPSPDFNLLLTDVIAFVCIGFARFSYQNEVLRHKLETDHLQLQLGMLKTQLQPHFLFNTLNGLYGMSLTGSKDTPRFILLLSQMMQYILYDCDKEEVALADEINFLTGYFELEQKKFPNAKIEFIAPENTMNINIPPLLFLPLVENSFKHGKHKIEDTAGVEAKLVIGDNTLTFTIKNDTNEQPTGIANKGRSGIGLVNIKKRLELYYPGRHRLLLQDTGKMYIAEVIIEL